MDVNDDGPRVLLFGRNGPSRPQLHWSCSVTHAELSMTDQIQQDCAVLMQKRTSGLVVGPQILPIQTARLRIEDVQPCALLPAVTGMYANPSTRYLFTVTAAEARLRQRLRRCRRRRARPRMQRGSL
jgi:hypothetical protein